jgi:hypothetical protein
MHSNRGLVTGRKAAIDIRRQDLGVGTNLI